MVREGPADKAALQCRLQGSEGVNNGDIWGQFQAGGMAGAVWEHAWCAHRMVRWPVWLEQREDGAEWKEMRPQRH